ncbi:UNVERIFIED_CONTAM: hypothetical protein H355_014320, partial [Colinus virginianus]
LTSFEDYPCPLGYWCPGKGDAFFCPPGTSRVQPGAKSLEDCDPCSAGYYCPDPAQTGLPNTQGVPCEPGYECPADVCFLITVLRAVPTLCLVKEDTWPSAHLGQGIPLRNSAGSVMQEAIVTTPSSLHPVSPAQQASSAHKVNCGEVVQEIASVVTRNF